MIVLYLNVMVISSMDSGIAVYDCESLVIVGFPVPKVICGVDDEVGSVDVVAFAGSLKQLGVVHNTIFVEMNLLVLDVSTFTFMFVPTNLNSYNSTVKSYFN